ncbi:hypothetical protein FOA52_015824 [Chlamydomonas sp. UWO 241]|nr:hypothetical protein FOA52_015824 [Chlamydomonas sp. UWO 241]
MGTTTRPSGALLLALACAVVLVGATGFTFTRATQARRLGETVAVAEATSTGTPSEAISVAKDGEKVVTVVKDGVTQDVYDNAPTCKAVLTESSKYEVDADGHYWGWEDDKSCKFADTTVYPICKGSPADSKATPDEKGHLWGWENDKTCAYASAR